MDKALLLLGALLPLACGPGDPAAALVDTPMSGTVDGAPWTLSAAATNPASSDNQVFSTTFVSGLVDDPCSGALAPPLVLSRVPTTAGTYPLSDELSVIFSVDAGGNNPGVINHIATEGVIRVDEVDADQGNFTGAIFAVFDDDNEVNGTFTATLCVAEE